MEEQQPKFDVVVKQSLARNADPNTAIDYCQSDRRSRYACNQLPIQEKTRICLGDDDLAKRCDDIPMITKEQFFALIPRNILVFPDDPLQLRREFYSQNYKRADQGFTSALYEAKLMNTICALVRPDINSKYGDVLPPLPPYVDAKLIQQADQLFRKFSPNTNYTITFYFYNRNYHEAKIFSGQMIVQFSNSNIWSVNILLDDYRQEPMEGLRLVIVDDYAKANWDFVGVSQISEELPFRFTLISKVHRSGDEPQILNTFHISRIIKFLFDFHLIDKVLFSISESGKVLYRTYL